MDIVWDGITQAGVLNDWAATARSALADAAKEYNWPRAGAAVEVARRSIGLGAWRTLQNTQG
jgi:hypothetical protein